MNKFVKFLLIQMICHNSHLSNFASCSMRLSEWYDVISNKYLKTTFLTMEYCLYSCTCTYNYMYIKKIKK